MPAPVIAAIIGAGASVGGQVLANKGNKDAAKTEADAADKALAVQERIYNTQRGDLAPYRQIGGSALSALAQGMGFAPITAASEPAPTHAVPATPMSPAPAQPHIAPIDSSSTGGAGYQLGMKARAANLSQLAPTPAQQQTQSSYVQMRAPNGQVSAVPPDQVDHFTRLGAQRVS